MRYFLGDLLYVLFLPVAVMVIGAILVVVLV
ncbi:hypothetical protein SAMN04489718_3724 [Actinopolyspora saharensis]|uniref:Uncharacterized protein n=1 Tax=Actinopolyspora saharensis TaxID=995062 RepID=A0A1H1GM98_9ACTN|nr:hypothetical protein SAMN04489718_3724 [Actinopolyspora saharensis]